MSLSQTVVYSPGDPSEALLFGSRLPHCLESEQQGEYEPQSGPAAQAVHPMYSGLAAM
jgi:hypothetical protein